MLLSRKVLHSSFMFLSHNVSFRLCYPDMPWWDAATTVCGAEQWDLPGNSSRWRTKPSLFSCRLTFILDQLTDIILLCSPKSSWGSTAEKAMGSRSGWLKSGGNVWASFTMEVKLCGTWCLLIIVACRTTKKDFPFFNMEIARKGREGTGREIPFLTSPFIFLGC